MAASERARPGPAAISDAPTSTIPASPTQKPQLTPTFSPGLWYERRWSRFIQDSTIGSGGGVRPLQSTIVDLVIGAGLGVVATESD
jgi:hypothetical protein